MKYIEMASDGFTVKKIFSEFDPTFPNIPITSRFSKDFLDTCMVVEEDLEVEEGYVYNKETNTFSKPIEEEEENSDGEVSGFDNTLL